MVFSWYCLFLLLGISAVGLFSRKSVVGALAVEVDPMTLKVVVDGALVVVVVTVCVVAAVIGVIVVVAITEGSDVGLGS